VKDVPVDASWPVIVYDEILPKNDRGICSCNIRHCE
jgi:hypothetical protein